MKASPDADGEAEKSQSATSNWEHGRPARNKRVSANKASESNAKEEKRGSRFAMRARRPRSQQTRRAKHNIGDYSRDERIDVLLKGMGKKWWTREDAVRAAARRLGFQRTGRQIRDAFKSAINGAIRRGLLEHDGQMIRRTK